MPDYMRAGPFLFSLRLREAHRRPHRVPGDRFVVLGPINEKGWRPTVSAGWLRRGERGVSLVCDESMPFPPGEVVRALLGETQP